MNVKIKYCRANPSSNKKATEVATIRGTAIVRTIDKTLARRFHFKGR